MSKAKAFLNSGFWMAGLGHFDLTQEEVVKIFQILEEPKAAPKLKAYYLKLCEQRDMEPWGK